MGWIDAAMQQLWVAQKTAAAPGYHNSYGKDFVKCLLNYVLLSQNKSSNISAFVSTGPGPLQPGHMTVRWQLKRMERRSTVRDDDHSLHHSLYEIILLDFALLLKNTHWCHQPLPSLACTQPIGSVVYWICISKESKTSLCSQNYSYICRLYI